MLTVVDLSKRTVVVLATFPNEVSIDVRFDTLWSRLAQLVHDCL